MKYNEEMLNEKIASLAEKVEKLEPGTQEHTAAVASLERLIKLENDTKRVKLEVEKDEREEKFRRDQLKWDTICRNLKTGVELIVGGSTIVLSFWYGVKGFKFEETGTYVSKTFNNASGLFRPRR
jgi:hypothetical protein